MLTQYTTLVYQKWGRTRGQSAFAAKPIFSSQQTEAYQHLLLTSTFNQRQAAVGGRHGSYSPIFGKRRTLIARFYLTAVLSALYLLFREL